MSLTPGPYEASGQLIVTKDPCGHPNPKAQATCKTISAMCWDFCGDTGATEPRISFREMRANQRLFIASPKLLAACEMLMQAWNDGEETNDVEWEALTEAVNMAREAIAEVKHET